MDPLQTGVRFNASNYGWPLPQLAGDISAMNQTAPSVLWGSDFEGTLKALVLIFLAEIGDKTFFVSVILAMKYDKMSVFTGSMAA